MAVIRVVSQLFEPLPTQWGLRGDPYLWAEMTAALNETSITESWSELQELLEQTFLKLVGSPLNSEAPFAFIERYNRGGMSSGKVSVVFWRTTAMPLLQSRYMAIKTSHT